MPFTVKFPLGDLTQARLRAEQRLAAERDILLNTLGTQVLSFAQQDYVTKARGGEGTDGITWDPLQRSTLAARVARRAPYKALVRQRKSLAGMRDAKSRAKRKQITAKQHALIDKESSRYEIGVDTGLQRASAAPGHPDNLFDLSPSSVTVGYNREYSEHFDAKRQLLPEELPDAWQEELNALTLDWAVRILEEEMT